MRIPHSERVLSRLALALASSRPLLLSGPAGCGKSALVGELARRLGQHTRLVRVHMDEQIDSKVLLGTYVCAEGSGAFAWQPGVVSQAVRDGRWLLLEDVDRAPLEVMAALAPLLEGGALYLPGRATALSRRRRPSDCLQRSPCRTARARPPPHYVPSTGRPTGS